MVSLGVAWPDYDLPVEPGTIRAFLEGAHELGYDHVTISDHVVIANYSNKLTSSYSVIPDQASNGGSVALKREEAMTMLACMAGISPHLGYMTAAITLPKRPTLLVAEVAATLDRLTSGLFRLGVGVGSEEIEFQVLGSEFSNRGARFEEQIDVLRTLWSGTHEPRNWKWHAIPEIDVFGPAAEHLIPIWITAGDNSPKRVLQRIGRLADGVIPPWLPDDHARQSLEIIAEAAREAGRDFSKIGIEPKVALRQGKHMRWRTSPKKDDAEIARELAAWLQLGATHIEFKTRRCGLLNVDEHIEEMKLFHEIVNSSTQTM